MLLPSGRSARKIVSISSKSIWMKWIFTECSLFSIHVRHRRSICLKPPIAQTHPCIRVKEINNRAQSKSSYISIFTSCARSCTVCGATARDKYDQMFSYAETFNFFRSTRKTWHSFTVVLCVSNIRSKNGTKKSMSIVQSEKQSFISILWKSNKFGVKTNNISHCVVLVDLGVFTCKFRMAETNNQTRTKRT